MKLVKVRIRNFRCYSDEISVELGDLTVLVGKNDVGKSSILDALAIFFGEGKLDSDDACLSGNKKDVRIICEFKDLPEQLVIDADYPTTLADEYLLNQDGHLEIHQVFDGSLKTPKLTGTFAHAIHPSVEGRNDLLLLKNKDLKERAKSLHVDLEEVNLRINTEIRRKIWNSTPELGLQSTEIPLDVETAKEIWAQLKKYLPNFAVFKSDRSSTDQDAEAQDPMKTAIKEALKAQEAELNRIAEYVETEVKTIAKQTVSKLREMDPTLANELNPRFTPPNWANVFKVSLTGDEEIPINKRGSGVRRLILLNFFRAKAEQRAIERDAPSIIYAVEEPETSQHPNNQKMLLNAFYQLAEQPDCQVILTTHTPTLGRLVPSDSLRYVFIDEAGDIKIQHGDDATYERVAKALGVLADHDIKLFIGVEGGHDINFLKNISKLLKENGEDVPDLQLLEDQGEIIFFPLGGSNLALWTSRLAGLNRPEFFIFDRDCAPPATPIYQNVVDEINQRTNCEAVVTDKKEMENYLHSSAISAVRPEVVVAFGEFDSVPELVAKKLHDISDSPNPWDELSDEKKGKKISRAKVWLNAEASAAMTSELLNESDPNGNLRNWLIKIGNLLESAS